MVRVHYEKRAESIAAKASDNPHDASRFECYRSPVSFVVESVSSNIYNDAGWSHQVAVSVRA